LFSVFETLCKVLSSSVEVIYYSYSARLETETLHVDTILASFWSSLCLLWIVIIKAHVVSWPNWVNQGARSPEWCQKIFLFTSC